MKFGVRRRGVALVYALFTTAVLIIMSMTFVALSIRHGQTTTTINRTEAALQAANWALDFALNYMGDGANWQISSSDSSGFTLSFHLIPKLETFQGMQVQVQTDSANAAIRTLSFPNFLLPIDASTSARTTVAVEEKPVAGQPTHYRVESRAEILDGAGQLVATRVVEARVREQSAADFLHFVQNARSWDAQGVDPGSANANDIVGIPSRYREAGKLRVDGGGAVSGKAGNLRLYNVDDPQRDVRFDGNVTINQNGNIYTRTDGSGATLTQAEEAAIFTGGLTPGASSLGLPDRENYVSTDKNHNGVIDGSEKGYSARIAEDTSGGTGFLDGHIQVGGTNISVGTGSAYADVERDPAGNDARPGLATVEIILNGDRVTVKKVSRYSHKEQVVYNDVPVDRFKAGVIAVDGGNVKIRSATDGSGNPVPFSGRLTVVSNDQASRNPTGVNGAGDPTFISSSIYHQAARDFYEAKPHLKPPYTAAQLGMSGDGLYWPPPATNVEREGNTILASDVQYAEGGTEAHTLGVVSRNFVLLNDETAGAKGTTGQSLRVDAVLMSLDHSVQFDWDNLGDNPWHANLLNPTSGSGRRTFQFNGSIVGGFLDVEGDVSGRGYTLQQFTHDENLRYNLPPAFPRWDRRNLPPGVVLSWVIMQYVDQGTVSGFR